MFINSGTKMVTTELVLKDLGFDRGCISLLISMTSAQYKQSLGISNAKNYHQWAESPLVQQNNDICFRKCYSMNMIVSDIHFTDRDYQKWKHIPSTYKRIHVKAPITPYLSSLYTPNEVPKSPSSMKAYMWGSDITLTTRYDIITTSISSSWVLKCYARQHTSVCDIVTHVLHAS